MGINFYDKKEIEKFQLKRSIISLYKSFLIMLEDLQEEHIENFEKLYENVKQNRAIISQADYFSDNKMTYLRKKVLDAGNDCIRNLTGEENGKRKNKENGQ